MNLTGEQVAVIDAVKLGGNVNVQALAGSGKSSTISMASKAIIDKRCIYLAFNKAIADEANGKMGHNTTCKTMHSMAYGGVPKELTAKLRHQRVMPRELAREYKLPEYEFDERRFTPAMQMSCINAGITNWCNSDHKEFSYKDFSIPEWIPEDLVKELTIDMAATAKYHWGELLNVKNKLPITHDVYLKQWALSNPTLPYDTIFLDECQDVSSVLLGVIKQQQAQVVAVGDSNQSIYQWRGAIDAMYLLRGDMQSLSKSFRFGSAVAEYADKILKQLGNTISLQGFEAIESKLLTIDKPDAILCRTNSGCINQLIEKSNSNDGRKYLLNCNVNEIKAFINAVKQIKQKGHTEHFVLSAFTSWNELLTYCEENPRDTEIVGTTNLIKKFGEDRLLDIVERSSTGYNTDCIITTAHKAKGLEWDKVKIHDDFAIKPVKGGGIKVSDAELRLIYVAVTRAKLELDTSGLYLLDVLLTPEDYFKDLIPKGEQLKGMYFN